MVLDDQVALVTGAGQGIGAATAVALGEAGAVVVAADINAASAERTAAAVADRGGRSLAMEVDVGDVAAIRRIVDCTMADFGRLDVLVNNAGVTRRADIMDLSEEDWDRIHRVNARGVFFCLQTAASVMIPRRSGRIINIASIAGKGYAGTSNAAYAASKGAVISLTRTAAQQLAKHNINVTAICPGITRTELSEANLRVRADQEGMSIEAMEARRAEAIPLRRVCEPSDIAAMAVFLASPGARNITGQSYNVDGGIIPE